MTVRRSPGKCPQCGAEVWVLELAGDLICEHECPIPLHYPKPYPGSEVEGDAKDGDKD